MGGRWKARWWFRVMSDNICKEVFEKWTDGAAPHNTQGSGNFTQSKYLDNYCICDIKPQPIQLKLAPNSFWFERLRRTFTVKGL